MKQQRIAETFGFFQAWLKNPLRVAAVAPSGRALAGLITSEINDETGPVIELGPGTGAFTRALIMRGVKETNLYLIEAGSEFAHRLRKCFPTARTMHMDAADLRSIKLSEQFTAGAVVSGLPLLSMPSHKVVAILEGAFANMCVDGALYQFTYGLRCPISPDILDRLNLNVTYIGHTFANFPPASVYRLQRRVEPVVTGSFPPLAGGR